MKAMTQGVLSASPAYDACRIEYSHFSLPDSPLEEWMLQLHVRDRSQSFEAQLSCLLDGYAQFCADHTDAQPVFLRVFMSDAANQEARVREQLAPLNGALSLIEQPPLDGSKLSLWVYLQSGAAWIYDAQTGDASCQQDMLQHLWTGSARRYEGNAHEQCLSLFEEYSEQLESRGGSLYAHAIRTWLLVQNVDVNYAGVVTGRNEHFDVKGLVPGDHFISSTGIQGRSDDHRSLVQLDTYSLLGVDASRVQFLYAPDYLDPTHDYGVRFERGTAVHYDDRSVCFISGTASIDNTGAVVHVGDIEAQCERMWQNVDALLAEAGASMDDSMQMIIYLRDIADYELIKQKFDTRFPTVPRVIVLAPVCRPTWLIEMECITVHAKQASSYTSTDS